MAKKKSASFPREKRVPASEIFTTTLNSKERNELRSVAYKPDSEIDFSDIPDLEGTPAQVHIGRFYRPIKRLISIRLDADVLEWFRGRGKRYQSYMNEVLRREMQSHPRGR
jgi:uncharacterized protein (DUF4415 family)